jgi:hypothetical protein
MESVPSRFADKVRDNGMNQKRFMRGDVMTTRADYQLTPRVSKSSDQNEFGWKRNKGRNSRFAQPR